MKDRTKVFAFGYVILIITCLMAIFFPKLEPEAFKVFVAVGITTLLWLVYVGDK